MSAIYSKIPTVNMAQARTALQAAMQANVSVMLFGDPGVGKTALCVDVAKDSERGLSVVIGSTLDPTDIGGLPVLRVGGKQLDRFPLSILRAACDEPRLVLLDEMSCATYPVQAAMLRLMLERVCGDEPLHPDSRVIGATNPPEQSPGGVEISAPMMGRCLSLRLRPTDDEVLEYFQTLGEEGSTLRHEAVDWSLTAKFQVGILQVDIPNGAVTGNIPWGAPRSWERALKARVAARDLGASDDVVHAVTAGSVGEECALAFSGIQKLRKELPDPAEIVKAPQTAKIPEQPQLQIAALGLIPRVADKNTWAAWIYASRLSPEMGTAIAHMLLKRSDSPLTSPHVKDGMKARVKLAGGIKRLA
jgi:hypothetical protein